MATGTEIQVVMPQMGVSVSEGTVTKWLKQVGETIAQDEPLLEISTDKVDTEVPSPGAGVVSQILVPEGQTVDVGTVLATIAPPGSAPAAPASETPPPAETPPAAEPAAPAPAPAPAEPVQAAQPPPVDQAPPPPAQAPSAPAPDAAGNGKSFVSPVVARIAAEHGVDPSSVTGTGTGGRVTKKDILAFVESGVSAEAPSAPPEPEPAPAPPAEAAAPPAAVATTPPPPPAAPLPPPAAPPAAAPTPPPAPPAAPPPPAPPAPAPVAGLEAGEEEEPVTAMRRGIAEHMRRSLDTSAHVTSAIEVDMSR